MTREEEKVAKKTAAKTIDEAPPARHGVAVKGKEKRTLSADLTHDEIHEYALQASRLAGEIDDAEAAEAARKKHAKEQIDGLRSRQRDLAQRAREGKELREVECEVWHDYNTGMRFVQRLDTFETIESRALYESERQQEIPA